MARTGHSREPAILGTKISLTWLLFCMVLDHFTNTRIFPGLKIISPLAKCLSGENPAHACGTRLDNRKNEKKLSKYKPLKICPIYVRSHCATIFFKRLTSIILISPGGGHVTEPPSDNT